MSYVTFVLQNTVSQDFGKNYCQYAVTCSSCLMILKKILLYEDQRCHLNLNLLLCLCKSPIVIMPQQDPKSHCQNVYHIGSSFPLWPLWDLCFFQLIVSFSGHFYEVNTLIGCNVLHFNGFAFLRLGLGPLCKLISLKTGLLVLQFRYA